MLFGKPSPVSDKGLVVERFLHSSRDTDLIRF